MPESKTRLLSRFPVKSLASSSLLLQRGQPCTCAIYLERGRVVLGVAAQGAGSVSGQGPEQLLEHQLGVVEGPAWLEANAAVLGLPSAIDAVSETEVLLRQIPLSDFRESLSGGSQAVLAVLTDLARAHRQQTELAVSRLAKDAEARCAEWLLRHAESTDLGVCSVKLQQRKRIIAAQLGIAPETLSRVLRHLRERSLISGSGRVLNLVDPNGLRSLAGV